MLVATATPVFPISEQYDGFDFDPQMYYAQVLGEVGNHGCFETLKRPPSIKSPKEIVAGGYISSSKVVEVQKYVGDLKRKRSWKNAIFFLKKFSRKQEKDEYEVQAVPIHSRFKYFSGTIYINDVCIDHLCRSNGVHSGPTCQMKHCPLTSNCGPKCAEVVRWLTLLILFVGKSQIVVNVESDTV